MNDKTMTFHPSYGPADVRRALARFPDATVPEIARFRDAVAAARARALGRADAAPPRSKNVLVRAAAAWDCAVEAVNDRMRQATMTSIAKDDAAGVYDKPTPVASEAPAQTGRPGRRCVPGSMMAHAMGYLENCGADGATPAQVYAAIIAAGWSSPAGKTPKNTLRAALLTAARKGHLRALGGGRYAAVA